MKNQMIEHPFRRLNKILIDNIKYLDKCTIKEANKLLNEVYTSLIANRSDRKVINQDKRMLLCLEVFGDIPRYYKLITIDFLEWLQIRIIKVDNILYWQFEYEEFIFFVKRKPNTFKELDSFSKLDHTLRTKIMISKFPAELQKKINTN